jgi:hypothetical protein
MRKAVLAGGVAVAALAAAYFGSPYWALHQIRNAAADGDGERVAAYVDFPAVRESLKSQFASALTTRMDAKAKDGPLASIGQAFATQMLGGIVDAMVTPQSIASMIQSGKALRSIAGSTVPSTQVPSERREPRVRRGYEGLNTFGASLVDPQSNEDLMTAVLTRQGLFSWKLTDLKLSTLNKR